MAITYTIYTATAAQTDFNITFPYIESAHVYVDINGTNTTAFTVQSGPKIVLTSGATAGDKVKVYRVTPGRTETQKDLLVDFQDGSVLSEADLDKACQQLIYLSQEAQETGSSSLPVDWDGNYTAGSKRIKDLSGTVTGSNDATTKDYVDGIALYGGAVSQPQAWAKTGADFSSAGGGSYTLNLTSPVASGDNQDLFTVSINGVLQRPTTDFTVVENSGVYTLTILGWTAYASGDIINIQNFGVARNFIKQPIKGEADGDVSLIVQKRSADQSGDLQQWQNDSETAIAKVDVDGDATFVDINATGNADVDGNLNVDGTAQIDGNTTIGSSKVTVVAATGNTDIVSGTLDVGGATTLDTTLNVAGETTLTGGVAGNLNILTGALQYAGVSAMTIRQIVTATTTGSETAITSTTDYKTTGFYLDITPKTSSSKILIAGAINIERDPNGTDFVGVDYNLYAHTSTQTVNATVAGSALISVAPRIRHSTDHDRVDFVSAPVFVLYEPGDTTRRYIEVAMRADTATTTDVTLLRTRSKLYAIEIG